MFLVSPPTPSVVRIPLLLLLQRRPWQSSDILQTISCRRRRLFLLHILPTNWSWIQVTMTKQDESHFNWNEYPIRCKWFSGNAESQSVSWCIDFCCSCSRDANLVQQTISIRKADAELSHSDSCKQIIVEFFNLLLLVNHLAGDSPETERIDPDNRKLLPLAPCHTMIQTWISGHCTEPRTKWLIVKSDHVHLIFITCHRIIVQMPLFRGSIKRSSLVSLLQLQVLKINNRAFVNCCTYLYALNTTGTIKRRCLLKTHVLSNRKVRVGLPILRRTLY